MFQCKSREFWIEWKKRCQTGKTSTFGWDEWEKNSIRICTRTRFAFALYALTLNSFSTLTKSRHARLLFPLLLRLCSPNTQMHDMRRSRSTNTDTTNENKLRQTDNLHRRQIQNTYCSTVYRRTIRMSAIGSGHHKSLWSAWSTSGREPGAISAQLMFGGSQTDSDQNVCVNCW